MYTKNDELGKNNIAYKKCGYVEYLIYKYIRYKCYTVIHMMLDFRGDIVSNPGLDQNKMPKRKKCPSQKTRHIETNTPYKYKYKYIYIYVFIIIYICIIYIYINVYIIISL